MTPSQLRELGRLARATDTDLNAMSRSWFGHGLERLTATEASALITWLRLLGAVEAMTEGIRTG